MRQGLGIKQRKLEEDLAVGGELLDIPFEPVFTRALSDFGEGRNLVGVISFNG